jgi:redox-sensitive bicupin YhaK (pirin superfamily)
VHHHDDYPAGDGDFAPDAPLTGRELGADFAGIDGWRMYHGLRVPGFPQHPHRGFETVTYVRRGVIDHSDSLGAAARFGAGDTQWLTAGRGIVHSEMFPLLDDDAPNPLELFQIWLNLPAESKLAEPHFSMLWARDVAVVTMHDDGHAVVVTIVAGALDGHAPPSPPPDSWASRPDADVAIWHVDLEGAASWSLPAARGGDSTVRVLYVYEGEVDVAGTTVAAPTAVVVRAGVDVPIRSGAAGGKVLMLQGRPIGEPVAQYGPFVMNDEREVAQAFADYRATGFGGWPWERDDPVHGPAERGRFARHADGHEDAPAPERVS